MKRDMDLIRLVLLDTEGEEKQDFSGFTEEQREYHKALVIEAGLVHGEVVLDEEGQPRDAALIRLTWKGHEFLDAARNQSIWRTAGERIKKAGIHVSMAVMEELLKKLLKESLLLP